MLSSVAPAAVVIIIVITVTTGGDQQGKQPDHDNSSCHRIGIHSPFRTAHVVVCGGTTHTRSKKSNEQAAR